MGFLKIGCTDLRGWNVRGDRQHRHARAMAIEQAVDEMEVAWSATSGADGDFSGQMGFRAGGEGRDLFMPDVNPLDLSLAANRIGEAVQAVTDNAVDALDPCCGKRFGELICNCACHGWFLWVSDAMRRSTCPVCRTNELFGVPLA